VTAVRAKADLAEALSAFGKVQVDEPLARHTSYRIGGPADFLVIPAGARYVPGLLARCHEFGLAVTVLGNGTNVLVRDGGIAGVVLRLSACTAITPLGNDGLVAEAGVSFPRLARDAARRGLRGLAFAVGIPGTVGGAVRMNAGAHGGELAQVLECVDIATLAGDVITLPADRLGLGYRASSLPAGIVLSAVFSLSPGDPAALKAEMDEYLDRRGRTQPILTPNAGSVFKNPPGDFAARLIEEAGCKGLSHGDAAVSERHANFIVNHGAARAADVLAVVEDVRAQVRARFGVELEMELKVIGRDVATEAA
jgi:UDP-N-acetylmuramate dehydrogenase